MAKKPETKFKEKVRARLNEIPDSYFEKIQQVCIRGTPDFLGCYNGRAIALELKVGRGKADALQSRTMYRARRAGALVREVRPSNLEEVIAEIKALK